MLCWNEDLATGIEQIDSQHKELFQKADAIFALKEPIEIEQAMDYFITYVIQHFGYEEEAMIRHQDPNFIEHRHHHTYFVVEIYKLNKKLHQQGFNDATLVVLKALLVDWLVNHIHEYDKHFAAYIRSSK